METSDCREHSHSRLVSNSQDRVVPTFEHTHDYSDRSHHHFVDKAEDRDLIPRDTLDYWEHKWAVE